MSIEHKGRSFHRTKREPIEAALAAAWERRNRADSFNNLTTLDWLAHGDGSQCLVRATQQEATLAATVIQWLGSPVGFSFLREALSAAGYEVAKKARAEK